MEPWLTLSVADWVVSASCAHPVNIAAAFVWSVCIKSSSCSTHQLLCHQLPFISRVWWLMRKAEAVRYSPWLGSVLSASFSALILLVGWRLWKPLPLIPTQGFSSTTTAGTKQLVIWSLTSLYCTAIKQSVALTERNRTGPPCSCRGAIIRLQAAWRHCLACAAEAACRPAVKCYRPLQTTDASDRY